LSRSITRTSVAFARAVICVCALLCAVVRATAQEPAQPAAHHSSPSPWMLMSDGVLFGLFNHQGTPRGGTEFVATNWWMGMASRNAGRGQLSLTGMISLDPLTATARGYREIFQAGEAYNGTAIVDRQHPHDFLMQAAAVYRMPITGTIGLTIAGAPVGEPALGPVAFMHRPSAAENPAAPLAHHTLDSTHIAMGVVTAALDRGPWMVETSVFHGREPDDNRWDLMDPGALDSWSGRIWFRPTSEWQLQFSHGFLNEPEELEPGDLRRTTASVSWFGKRSDGSTAVLFAYGRNDKSHGAFNAVLTEVTERRGALTFYGRLEMVQSETELLLGGDTGHQEDASMVSALTAGIVRDIKRWRGYEIGIGGDAAIYGVPSGLQDVYGLRAWSAHLFFRVRAPEGHMGRMWNMIMSRPM
jgi:hypothetical protein